MTVNDKMLFDLASKCLSNVQGLYPERWKDIILKVYWPPIEVLAIAKRISAWEAGVQLYNNARTPNDKVFYLAAVRSMTAPVIDAEQISALTTPISN